MKYYIIIIIALLIFITSCDKIDKDKSFSNSDLYSEVSINLKTVTICDEQKETELPTFLFYLQIINKVDNSFVFFVKNFDKTCLEGGFFLFFDNSDNEIVIELADFWSKNPVLLESKDTLKIMLTSVNDGKTILKWEDENKEEFLNSFKVVYHPNINMIKEDTSLVNFKILPRYVIIKNEKTRIFD